MNIVQDGFPVRTDLNVMYPPSAFRSDAVDLEENVSEPTTAQNNNNNSTSTASESSVQHPAVVRVALRVYKAVADFLTKIKDIICLNKITAFVFLQLFIVILRLCRMVQETIFWLIFVPIFVILLAAVLHLCITAHRNSNIPQRQHITRHYHHRHHHHLNNLRRAQQELDQLNERIVHQILMNSANNRLDFLITGNRGQIRLMHLDPELPNSNEARMHFRLMSRGLLRLFADFIEERQQHQNRQRNGLTQEQIDNLPLERYLIPLSGVDEPETCSICINEFAQEQNLKKLPCNHKFHITCIDEWLKISNSCPNCKKEVIPNENGQASPQEP